jgi:hypothetical protein
LMSSVAQRYCLGKADGQGLSLGGTPSIGSSV